MIKRIAGMVLLVMMVMSLVACGASSGGEHGLDNELYVSSTSMTQKNGKMTISFKWKPEEGMTGTYDDNYELLFNREDAFNYQPYGTLEAEPNETHEINPDGDTTFEINLKEDVGLLDVGYYCLIKKCQIVTADGEEIEQEFRFEFQN